MSACTSSFTAQQTHKGLQSIGFVDNHKVSRKKAWVLPKGSQIYLSYPVVSSEIQKKHPMLAANIARSLQDAVNRKFIDTFQASSIEDERQLREHAQDIHSQFIFHTQLIDVVERYTDHVMAKKNRAEVGKDQIAIEIKIYDTESYTLLDVFEIQSSVGFFSSNQDHPDDLLLAAFDQFVSKL